MRGLDLWADVAAMSQGEDVLFLAGWMVIVRRKRNGKARNRMIGVQQVYLSTAIQSQFSQEWKRLSLTLLLPTRGVQV
jgi:hypothetical protein